MSPDVAAVKQKTAEIRDQITEQRRAIETPPQMLGERAPGVVTADWGATLPTVPGYQAPPEKPEVTLGQQVGAAFKIDNVTASSIKHWSEITAERNTPIDPNFNPLDHLTIDEQFDPEAFVHANSAAQLDAIRARRARELEARQQEQDGPLPALVAGLIASAVDVPTFLPLLGVTAGAGVAGNALRVGGSAAVIATGQEAMFQASQDFRPWTESALSVGFAGLLGGGIGGVAGKIAAQRAIPDAATMINQAANDVLNAASPPPFAPASAGAAATPVRDPALSRPVGQKILTGYQQVMSRVGLNAPALDVIASPSATSRSMLTQLVDTGLVDEGNVLGIASQSQAPLSARLEAVHGILHRVDTAVEAAYQEARQAAPGLARSDFFDEVGRAARGVDKNPSPQAKAVADWARENIFKPFGEELAKLPQFQREVDGAGVRWNLDAIKAPAADGKPALVDVLREKIVKLAEAEGDDVLKADAGRLAQKYVDQVLATKREGKPPQAMRVPQRGKKGSRFLHFDETELAPWRLKAEPGKKLESTIDWGNYFTRVYDHDKMVRGHVNSRGETFRAMVERNIREMATREGNDALRDTAAEVAADIEQQIRMAPLSRNPHLVITERGSMKGRTLDLPDSELQPWLKDDIMEILSRYVRTVNTDLEFHRRFGTLNVDDMLKRVRDDYTKLVDEATSTIKDQAKLEKKLRSLERSRLLDETQLAHIYNSLRGTNGPPADPLMGPLTIGLKGLRTWSFLKSMGGVVVSQLTDPFTLTAREGFIRTFGNLAQDMITGFKGIRLSIKEAEMGGVIHEFTSSSRVMHMLDLADRYSGRGRMDKAMTALGDRYATWTGLNHMNQFTKGWAAASAMTRILETAKKLEASGGDLSVLSKQDLRRMATSYLDPEMLIRIAKQSQHWEKHGGILVANNHLWDDVAARNAFTDAIAVDVNASILTPMASDVPRWTSSEVGKVVGQFKRWLLASQHRILIAGLQRHDAATMMSVVGAIGAGMLGEYLRLLSSQNGRERLDKMTMADWVEKGIDRSGFTGIGFELAKFPTTLGYNVMDRIKGKDVTNPPSLSQRAQPLGPAFSLLANLTEVTGDILNDKVTDRTIHAARLLAPTQNHLVLSSLWDLGEATVKGEKWEW